MQANCNHFLFYRSRRVPNDRTLNVNKNCTQRRTTIASRCDRNIPFSFSCILYKRSSINMFSSFVTRAKHDRSRTIWKFPFSNSIRLKSRQIKCTFLHLHLARRVRRQLLSALVKYCFCGFHLAVGSWRLAH